ncbi:MAG TPA: ATP-binding cassette domain-containing protein, partial [Pirellulales bacterium]|nr:ATP-binding cassette domain-containing protein [Pirellulales bacterium]
MKEARGELRFGRDAADPRRDVLLADEGVSFHHAVAIHAAELGSYWIADAGSAEGTFVNGNPIAVHRLVAGDLVQIGPFAWVFSECEGRLEPVPGIAGLRLDLVGAGVSGRLRPLNLGIAPGEFVGIVGPSGAGKSTLLKALIGVPAHLDQGRILADGRDVAEQRDWFRSHLGYVSQDKVVHDDLTPLQAVAFSAALRGRGNFDAASLLRQVDLERARWNAPIGQLSGGQEKRVRIAAELVNLPGLLVLDEPGSGLDWAREAGLTRLLKTLGHRGCTVVVVTHNLNQLAAFDRVLVLRAGELVFDGPPARLRGHAPAGNLAELDFDQCVGEAGGGEEGKRGRGEWEEGTGYRLQVTAGREAGAALNPQSEIHDRQFPKSAIRDPQSAIQAILLIRRELLLIANRRLTLNVGETWRWLRGKTAGERQSPGMPGRRGVPLPHVLVPLVVIPVCFATACHLAVKPMDRAMLGFLGVLSCIWMGASLSLTSIVNEREVFDHERLLFLRVGPYVAAKTLVLGLLSALESLVFFSSMALMRGSFGADGMLFGGTWPGVVLALVGLASTGLGLLISA